MPLHRLYDGNDPEDGEGDEGEAEGIAEGAADERVEQSHFWFHPEPAGWHIVLPRNDPEDEAHDKAGQAAPQAGDESAVVDAIGNADNPQ